MLFLSNTMICEYVGKAGCLLSNNYSANKALVTSFLVTYSKQKGRAKWHSSKNEHIWNKIWYLT